MDYIFNGFIEALKLIFSFDKELYQIVSLSVTVAFFATVISSFLFIPCFTYLGLKCKKTKTLQSILSTFMCTPSVLVGLVVFLIFARRGPLADLEFLYTPYAIIIAEFVLITPLIASLTFESALSSGRKIKELLTTLGASEQRLVFSVMKEMRSVNFITITSGFSRAISEVGAVMIVGGNIRLHTRSMTTAITMLNSQGNYSEAIALGIILLVISFGINIIAIQFKGRKI